MGTKETLTDLRTFETGLSQYRARLEACWKQGWNLTLEERALVATDRGRLQREYGALRVAIAKANDGLVPLFGYGKMDLGEIGQVALSDPDDASSVMDALDSARQMAAQSIGYFEGIERDEKRPKPSPMAAPTVASTPTPGERVRLGGRGDPVRNRIGEALIVIGALLFGYPWQGFVLPPPTGLVPYLAAAGLVVTLVGLVLRLASPSPGTPPRELTHAAKIERAGDGARTASNVTGSGNTVTQVGRDAIGAQINLYNPMNDFKDVPHLNWDTLKYPAGDFELQVLCTLGGDDARVDPLSWVKSSNPSDRIEFVDFDTSGLIRKMPGTFWLRMRLVNPDPGERVISWRIVYHDTHNRRGYISLCSIPVSIRLGQVRYDESGGKKALDFTSPEERHTGYTQEYGTKRHSGST